MIRVEPCGAARLTSMPWSTASTWGSRQPLSTIIGVDTHKRSHTFVTVDDNVKRLKVHTGATTTEANLVALQ